MLTNRHETGKGGTAMIKQPSALNFIGCGTAAVLACPWVENVRRS